VNDQDELADLVRRFPGIAETLVIDVLRGVGGDQSKAIERLQEMAAGEPHVQSRHASKKRDQGEGQRMRQKHPSRVPVICLPPKEMSIKPAKLLVPGAMRGNDFIKIAREKCSWSTDESEYLVRGGCPVPESWTMSTVDVQHKSDDGFLYVTVTSGRKGFATAAAEATDESPTRHESKQPVEFHLPDADMDIDETANTAKKLLQKFPERVPVLFEQNELKSLGLPAINKKLLVPTKMRCDELKWVLKNQYAVSCPVGDVDWERLCVVVGDTRLREEFSVKDVYDKYREQDGCLHIMLRELDVCGDTAGTFWDEDYMDAFDSLREMGKKEAGLEAALEAAKEKAAAAEAREAAAESRCSDESERAQHFAQAYLAETEKNARLEETLQDTIKKLEAETEKNLRLEENLQDTVKKLNSANLALSQATEKHGILLEAEKVTKAEQAGDFGMQLKASEKKFAVISCEKNAMEMELQRVQEEMKKLLKRTETAEKEARDSATRLTGAEQSRAAMVAAHLGKIEDLERKLQEAEMKLKEERAKTAADGFVHVKSTGEASAVDDWNFAG
jgi:GABA(A) receptor-associated protein